MTTLSVSTVIKSILFVLVGVVPMVAGIFTASGLFG